jgi:ElaB/YqjD/DUF883 family membrane-anchored ribosome-binding protein
VSIMVGGQFPELRDRKAKGLAGDASAQLAELKDTIAELGERVAEMASTRAGQARRSARSAARSMADQSHHLYDEGVEALHTAGDAALTYGRRAGQAVQRNPGLSLLGLAVGVGIVAAIIYASHEEDRRWFDRRKSGWF